MNIGVIAGLVLLTLAPARSRGADTVLDMLGWVPGRANVALFIDADEVQRSPIAVQGKWGEGNKSTFGLDSLPANAARLVVASQYDPSRGPVWEVVIASQRKPVTEAVFARQNGGTRDTIGGKPVILTPRHGIVAPLAPTLAGAFQPPNRQEAARWLRAANGQAAPDLSPYLKLAAAGVKPASPVVLAFDTTDMFDPTVVKAKLAKVSSLKEKSANVDIVTALVCGMRGVTLTISLTDQITAELRVDFDRPAAPLTGVAKPLFLAALERMGVHDPEMDAWTETVSGTTVVLGGKISLGATESVLSPFLRPSAGSASPDDSSAPGADLKAQASLEYFQGVNKKIREVRESKNPTFPKLAFTFNNAARRIDDLRILNVDDELLAWGAALTTSFRTMGIVAQAAAGQIDLLEANKAMMSVSTPNYYYGSAYGAAHGYWGGAAYGINYAVPDGTVSNTVVSNYGQIANLQTMTNQQEHEYRMNTWKNIEAATIQVRRNMVKKYSIEF
jgi:hypothetical protein